MARHSLVGDAVLVACGKRTMGAPCPSLLLPPPSSGRWGTVAVRHLQATSSPSPCSRVPGLVPTALTQDYRHSRQFLFNKLYFPPALHTPSHPHPPQTTDSLLALPHSKTLPQTLMPTTNKTPSSPCNYIQQCSWCMGGRNGGLAAPMMRSLGISAQHSGGTTAGTNTIAQPVAWRLSQGLGWILASLLPLLLHGAWFDRGHLLLRGHQPGQVAWMVGEMAQEQGQGALATASGSGPPPRPTGLGPRPMAGQQVAARQQVGLGPLAG